MDLTLFPTNDVGDEEQTSDVIVFSSGGLTGKDGRTLGKGHNLI